MRILAKELQDTQELHPLAALEQAMGVLLAKQCQIISIPKRFTQIIREIWLLQYRFSKRLGTKPLILLEHARFRASFDFLALRALVGDESLELANWWTLFQDADEATKDSMLKETQSNTKPKKRRRKPKIQKAPS